MMPSPRHLKVGRWGSVAVYTFVRPAGESVVRVPYTRLLLGRSWGPKKASLRLNGGRAHEFAFRSGVVTLIPRDATSHGVAEEVELVQVFHDPVIYRRALDELGASSAVDFDFIADLGDPNVARVAGMLAQEVEGPGFGEKMFVEGLSYTLAVQVLRCVLNARLSQPGSLSRERLRQVQEFVDAHLSDSELSLHELAAVACLRTYHFARAFRQSTGSTPHQFVLARRIDFAKELLRDGRLPLSEIARCAGFTDQAHFGNRFRQMTGFTPRQYQRAVR